MKAALLSLALLLTASAFAQLEIPNPSFEGWNMDNTWNPTPDDWIIQNWQTIVALLIVAITVVLFALRLVRPKNAGSCGGDCSCDAKKLVSKEL